MRRTKSEVYLHIVWATKGRDPLLTEQNESRIHRCIQEEAQRLNAVVLALGGMPNHVHLAVRVPTAISIADLVKQVKGTSSAFANRLSPDEDRFRWQDNYSVFSISRSHIPRVIAYVQRQKEHHAGGKLWPEWEETDEEKPA